jgi:hypothetical protein
MTSTTKPAAAKAPQDRKPKQSELLAAEAANVIPAGGELLKLETLPAWDQAEAIASITDLFGEMGIDLDAAVADAASGDDESAAPEADIKLTSANIRTMGKLIKLLVDYAEDEEKFTAAVSGPGALTHGVDVAMWYFGALGEGSSSAS